MDGKIKYTHYDKPAHQRWLYRLADLGIVRAIMFIWALCIILIVVSLLAVKAVLWNFK